MIVVVVVVMMMIVMMIVVMVIFSHHDRLFFRPSNVAATLVLGAQNILGIRDGVQQLGKRTGCVQAISLIDRSPNGRL